MPSVPRRHSGEQGGSDALHLSSPVLQDPAMGLTFELQPVAPLPRSLSLSQGFRKVSQNHWPQGHLAPASCSAQ